MTLPRLLLIILTLLPSLVLADTVCGISGCRIQLDFIDGGSIEAPDGMILHFGSNGSVNLGATGGITLGATGSLNGATESDLFDGSPLALGQTISFDALGSLVFSSSGTLDLGEGGNIEYSPGTIININTASTVTINDQGSFDFVIDKITGLGGIDVTGSLTVNQASAETGLTFLNDISKTHFVMDFPSVTINQLDTVSGSITAGGLMLFNNDLVLADDTFITAENDDDIYFNGSINAAPSTEASLTVATSGITFFNSIGTTEPLHSLTTNTSDGTAELAGEITTTGPQTYNGSVILSDNLTLNAGDVQFSGTVEGSSQSLTVSTTGGTTFVQTIGDLTVVSVTEAELTDVTEDIIALSELADCEVNSDAECEAVEVTAEGDVVFETVQAPDEPAITDELTLAYFLASEDEDNDDEVLGSFSTFMVLILLPFLWFRKQSRSSGLTTG